MRELRAYDEWYAEVAGWVEPSKLACVMKYPFGLKQGVCELASSKLELRGGQS